MKNSLRLIAVFFLLFTFITTPSALATDIPLLTWEKGKAQSVVLGGRNLETNWKVYLKDIDSKLIELRPSLTNQAGFIVYSINIPKDAPNGAYSVITIGELSPETLVAAVEIVEMRKYEITRVPGDLIFFLVTIALLFSALAALRSKEFRKVTFLSSTGPKERYLAGEPVEQFIEHVYKLNIFEKLRINIYEQLPDSFFKYLLKSESRGMHLEFPILWSILPGISIAASSVFGYLSKNEFNLRVTGLLLVLLVFLIFIGSIDIYSGILSAFAFSAIRLWLIPEFAISSIALTIVTSLVFFVPALVSSYFTALLRKSFTSGFRQSLKVILIQWIFPLLFLHSTFIIQRSISGSTQSTFGIEALLAAAILFGRQIENFLSCGGLKWRTSARLVEEFEVNLGRLISPGFVFSILILFVAVFYTWTFSLHNAVTLATAVATPLFLLVIRPTWKRLKILENLKRNPLLEVLIVAVLTFVVFVGTQYLPLVAGTSAIKMILLGISPMILHALISFAADLSEIEKNEEVA